MNEQLQRQLIRQLKLLNFWITTFGTLFLVALAILGYFLFQTVMFMRDTGQKIENFQAQTRDSLDVKKQACENNGAFGDFLRSSTKACE